MSKRLPTPPRLARIDTKCPHCQKEWAILLTKKELKQLLKQLKDTQRTAWQKGVEKTVRT